LIFILVVIFVLVVILVLVADVRIILWRLVIWIEAGSTEHQHLKGICWQLLVSGTGEKFCQRRGADKAKNLEHGGTSTTQHHQLIQGPTAVHREQRDE